MATIKLELEIEGINRILKGLGTQPYGKVYQLVQKIHQQAEKQLNSADSGLASNVETKTGP